MASDEYTQSFGSPLTQEAGEPNGLQSSKSSPNGEVLDWVQAVLGSAETWSACLKTAVGLVTQGLNPMFLVWGQNRVGLCNQRCADLLAQVTEADCQKQALHPYDIPQWQPFNAAIEAVFSASQPLQPPDPPLTYPAVWPDYAWSFNPVWEDSQQVGGVIATGNPIIAADSDPDQHRRQQTEAALRESEERFYTLANHISQFAWMADPSGYIFWYNRRWFEYTGRTQEEMQGWGWQAVHHPDYVGPVSEKFRACIEQGEPWEDTFPLRSQTGEYRWFLSRALPIRDRQGRIVRWFGTNTDITQRMQAEERLRISEERFRQLANAMPQIVWIVDEQGHTEFLNQQWFDYTGMEPAVLPSQEAVLQTMHPDDVEPNLEQWTLAQNTGTIYQAEFRLGKWCPYFEQWTLAQNTGTIYQAEFRLRRGSDQAYRWFLGRALPLVNEQDHSICWYGTSTDIDDAKQIAEALRQSEARARLAVEVAQLGTWQFKPGFNCVELDERMCQIWGEPGDSLTLPLPIVLERIHLEDRAHVMAAVREALDPESSGTYTVEYRLVRNDGLERWLLTNGQVQFSEGSGRRYPVGFFGTALDITDRKQAEAALRQSEERLRLAMAGVNMGTWDLNLITGRAIWSDQYLSLLGYNPKTTGEANESLWVNVLHPEDQDQVLQEWQQACQERRLYHAEYRVVRADNHQVAWLAALGSFTYDAAGQAVRSMGVTFDISKRKRDEAERKRAEEALRQSEERYRFLAESIPQLVWTADAEGALLDVNQRWIDFTGITLEKIHAQAWNVVVHPEDIDHLHQRWTTAQRRGCRYQAEGRMRRHDGHYRWHLHQAVPLKDRQGRVLKWFGTATDIESQKQLEQQRDRILQQEQAAREAAERANRVKDEFLAVLSHELRSPLNPILGWVGILRSRPYDPKIAQRAIATIERNAKLQAQLVEDLLDVSRILQGKLSLNIAPVDVKATLLAALETVRLAAEAKSIHITTAFDRDLPRTPVLGDANRLQQVFWNLLSNAVKFTPAGGQVTVRLSPAVGQDNNGATAQCQNTDSSSAPSSFPRTTLPPSLQIQVQDTGQGIQPEFLPHIFESFRQANSTTTRQFGGLGLGLAIVRQVVELHGGVVQASSEGTGQGATFTVWLPLQPTYSLESKKPKSSASGAGTLPLDQIEVLVVDDETDTREMMTIMLEQVGAQVMAADSAQSALSLLSQTTPDLIISDIAMPDVDGYMLMRQIRSQGTDQAAIPAIALTAYARDSDQQAALAAGFQHHLPKPLDQDTLVETILTLVK